MDAVPDSADGNPYRAPQAADASPVVPSLPPQVIGSCIVFTGDLVLPPRCIVTNVPIPARDYSTVELQWAPAFRLVLSRHKCQITYGMARSVFRQKLKRRFSKLAALLLGVGLIWLVTPRMFLPGLIFAIFAASNRPLHNLKVVDWRDGQFWVRGAGDEFLAQCQRDWEIAEATEAL